MRIKALGTATAAVALLIVGSLAAGPASASTTYESPAGATAEQPPARFNLTPAQATTLQAQIDKQLAAAPGVQISQNEIAYDGGATIMSFNIPGQKAAPGPSRIAAPDADGDVEGCPYGDAKKWTCVYEFRNFNKDTNGRKLQFSACGGHNLRDYNFADMTSSWVNTSNYEWHVSNFTSTGSLSLLWRMAKGSKSSSVPYDNMADFLDKRC